ncbi:hypothetical protein SO694_00058167 [Aureococcus anophagefferens]|uniref:Uncharacterized protein n=1 Tax=Aureococcus anophagefferens TaxID=44056 RepID=A0ABR1FZ26_AURAN|nr:hypothetical protein JL722_4490 [Aureococcus anophagefferens]KAH8070516.1 hypothetical protein JL721_4909 [Aureococcus anophagefferens]
MLRSTLIACVLSVACAFVAPSHSVAPLRAATSMDMSVADAPELVTATNNFLVAASENDFGGYFFPVAGLTLLGAIITFLSPPLKDE